MLSSFNTVTLKPCTNYLIDEVDESLSLFAPKVPCGGDPGRRMHKGPNIRDGFCHRHICHTEAIVEDGYWWRQGGDYGRVGSLWAEDCPRRIFDHIDHPGCGVRRGRQPYQLV